MIKTTITSALAVLVVATCVVTPFAEDKTSDEDPPFLEVWNNYVVAQKRIHVDLFQLIVDKWPDLESIATLNRDYQVSTIQLSDMKFTYLAETDPGRIVLDDGLSAFTNVDWKESDSDELRAADPEFGKLEDLLVKTNKQMSEHPDRLGIHGRILELMKGEAYNSIMIRYNERMDQLEKKLEIAALEAREE